MGIEWLIRKLTMHGPLMPEEVQTLRATALRPRRLAAGQDLRGEGDAASGCPLLLEGMACRYRLIGEGRRQILAFQFPGDILALEGMLLDRLDHGIAFVMPSVIATLPHATLLAWVQRHPRLGQILWRETLVEAAVFREWVVNVGRRSAYERVAHVLCEITSRLRALGMGEGDRFDLPLRQSDLADATGLSQVHVNRTLQALRRDGLIRWAGRTLTILNRGDFEGAAGFEPSYLHGIGI